MRENLNKNNVDADGSARRKSEQNKYNRRDGRSFVKLIFFCGQYGRQNFGIYRMKFTRFALCNNFISYIPYNLVEK